MTKKLKTYSSNLAIYPLLVLLSFVLSSCGSENKPSSNSGASDDIRNIIGGTSVVGSYDPIGELKRRGNFICTATLVTPDVIVTAAHCVTGSTPADLSFSFLNRGTSHTYGATDVRIPSNDYSLSDIAFRCGFGRICAYGYDMALVKLSKRAQSMSLYPLASTFPLPSSSLSFVGFGMDENVIPGIKRQAGISVQGYSNSYSARNRSKVSNGLVRVSASKNDSKRICYGDSGGPSLVSMNGSQKIVGINSFGANLRFDVLEDPEDIGELQLLDRFLPLTAEELSQITTGARLCSFGFAYQTAVPAYSSFIAETLNTLNPPGQCKKDDGPYFATLQGGCLQFSNGRTWSQAISGTFSQSKANEQCENLVQGGFADWRLPAESEFRQLIAAPGAPTAYIQALKTAYWSSTRHPTLPAYGRVVSLSTGNFYWNLLSTLRRAVCVRGGV